MRLDYVETLVRYIDTDFEFKRYFYNQTKGTPTQIHSYLKQHREDIIYDYGSNIYIRLLSKTRAVVNIENKYKHKRECTTYISCPIQTYRGYKIPEVDREKIRVMMYMSKFPKYKEYWRMCVERYYSENDDTYSLYINNLSPCEKIIKKMVSWVNEHPEYSKIMSVYKTNITKTNWLHIIEEYIGIDNELYTYMADIVDPEIYIDEETMKLMIYSIVNHYGDPRVFRSRDGIQIRTTLPLYINLIEDGIPVYLYGDKSYNISDSYLKRSCIYSFKLHYNGREAADKYFQNLLDEDITYQVFKKLLNSSIEEVAEELLKNDKLDYSVFSIITRFPEFLSETEIVSDKIKQAKKLLAERRIQEKENQKIDKLNRWVDEIKEFINSGLTTQEFCENKEYTKSNLTKHANDMENINPELYKEYKDYIENKKSKSFAIITTKIHKLLNLIKYTDFTITKYFLYTNLPFNDLSKIVSNMNLSNEDEKILKTFIAINKKKCRGLNINAELKCEKVLSGKEVSDEDKHKVLSYMAKNNLPTYASIYDELLRKITLEGILYDREEIFKIPEIA